ncbi:M67 family metallopeptidase [Methylophaga sp. OBS3]|uniref:M67 family metallopeptidase n=1 Tax=Methylophaga sp. OBS3 TaxID=2991934 RepID=UPI0022562B61|nr:M67 family metallopeptidase [Methylophaga sp. OBS3]MCX4190733.1 M67 family metallopeptidase [Methylophaga sp. OBS3]
MTQKQTVRIPRTLVNALLHQAQLSPSREVCGLVGRKQDDCVCYPLEMQETDASVMFALNASEQLTAIKAIEAAEQALYAVYHSHPNSPALPAITDEDVADFPEALYLLISLNTKGVLEMRGFDRQSGKLEEVDLII